MTPLNDRERFLYFLDSVYLAGGNESLTPEDLAICLAVAEDANLLPDRYAAQLAIEGADVTYADAVKILDGRGVPIFGESAQVN